MSHPPAVADDVAQRRAEALRMSRDGMSLRAIADQLGTSKDTVSRDIKAAECDEASQALETPETPEPVSATPVAPAPADCLTVAYDAKLRADMAVLEEAGLSPEGAIRYAVAIVAYSYRSAWELGICPRGVAPLIRTTTARPGTQKEVRL